MLGPQAMTGGARCERAYCTEDCRCEVHRGSPREASLSLFGIIGLYYLSDLVGDLLDGVLRSVACDLVDQ